MIDVKSLDVRTLQKESARVLASGAGFSSHDLTRFNQAAHHDSHAWYRAVVQWYVDQHGGLPSQVGPGQTVKLIMETGS